MTALPEVDAVVVGMGWCGGILAAELTKAGMSVVGLERGPAWSRAAGAFADSHDELHRRRATYTQEIARETWTLRHHPRERSLPFRYAGSFTPGRGVGGSSLLYGAHAWRLQPYDFTARTSVLERYGRDAVPDDCTIADWGITFADLEPYYDRFEKAAGIGGLPGNLDGTVVAGGNPFEGPRSSPFPVPPMAPAAGPERFREAVQRLGYRPFPVPGGTLSQPYTNPDGISRPACTSCGFCIGLPCQIGAKADALATVLPVAERSGRFELRGDSNVVRVLHDGRRAYGVRYYDADGRLQEQRAGIVVLSAYALNNVRLLLLSGMGAAYDPATGRGVVGRNASYNFILAHQALYAGERFESYLGSGANGSCITEFNADNFDHAPHGFVGGGVIWSSTRSSGPLAGVPVPPDTPRWGAAYKRALRDWFDRSVIVMAHGEVLPYRDHHLDLDPAYRDAWGEPLLRLTFDWREPERRRYRFLDARVQEIVAEMRPDHVVPAPAALPAHFDTAVYQGTHNTGGAIMGADPASSVVDPWLRMWDFDNVWVVGGSAFPQSGGVGPTGTIGALAYRAAAGIVGNAAELAPAA